MAAAVAPMPSIENEHLLESTTGQDMDTTMHEQPEMKPVPPVTPPATDESSKDHASNASDLSDLDLDDEDEEEIEPDHYYDGGKIPVFKPTMDQFRSFKKFIEKIDKYGMKSGIVKVVPPQEWLDSLPALDEQVKTIKIKNPITQDFAGQYGAFTQANVEKQRSYNLPQWKALTEESQHQPPAKRGERRRNQAPVRSAPGVRAANAAAAQAEGRTPRKPGRPPRRSNLATVESTGNNDDEEQEIQTPPTPTSPNTEAAEPPKKKRGRPFGSAASAARAKACAKTGGRKSSPAPKIKGPGGAKSVAERRKYNTAMARDDVDEAAFENFDYRFEYANEFTQERCAELETQYWKSLTFAPPMYGGDMPGSLFDETTTSWNVAKLENTLDVIGQKVPGVNTTYLYLGMWKATFAWHLEDVDLYSINYVHFGAPKQWYSISQEDARKFENAMKQYWPNDAKNCSQFLRHKTYLISPDRLEKEYNIKVNKLVHYEGEFVITFPYGYHSGYNLGYNCAESVNFATEAWLDYGRIAKKCDCEADSVWIDVAEIERKLRGEATPEYYEETDDEDDLDDGAIDMLTPPASVKGRGRPKAVGKKRKRSVKEEKDQGKKKVKKIRIRLNTYQPCVLCATHIATEPLLATDTGKQAHRCCALYTPETRIEERDGRDIVVNVSNIDRARLDLKCNSCRSKLGACFQCSATKCTRAFHATCAAAAGVQADFGPTAVYGTDGTEYATDDWDFRCKFHRARRPKTMTAAALESNGFVRKAAAVKIEGDVVQCQYVGGEVFGGIVVENRHSERTLIVDVLPDGVDRVEVEWRYLVALAPEDSLRRKPSPDALPLPEHMSDDIGIDGNVEFGPPREGDCFSDPSSINKWSEFNTAPNPRNRAQVKVDMDREDCLWHYLGKKSTEARAQFTEDPANARNNPKSNFLETVRPVPLPQPVRQPGSLSGRPSNGNYPNGTNFHALNAISTGKGYSPLGNQQFRYGKPVPYSANQQGLARTPSYGFPNNPYVPGSMLQQTNSMLQQRQQSQHQQTPRTPTTTQQQWRPQQQQQQQQHSSNYWSPSDAKAPTPSPITSPSLFPQTTREESSSSYTPTHGYHPDPTHLERLEKYPYISLSRARQLEMYPYGYTSPYPSETEVSKPYLAFLAQSDANSQHGGVQKEEGKAGGKGEGYGLHEGLLARLQGKQEQQQPQQEVSPPSTNDGALGLDLDLDMGQQQHFEAPMASMGF